MVMSWFKSQNTYLKISQSSAFKICKTLAKQVDLKVVSQVYPRIIRMVAVKERLTSSIRRGMYKGKSLQISRMLEF
jgi:hypothetical protein